MKTTTLKALLFLTCLWLYPALHFGQNIPDGMVVEEVQTRFGQLTLYRTDVLPGGELISGTIHREPFSTNRKKKQRQLEQLRNCRVQVGQKTVSEGDYYKIWLPLAEEVPVRIVDADGKLITELNWPLSPAPHPALLHLPSTIQSGSQSKISGRLSGDIAQTKIRIEQQEIKALAANQSEVYFEVPSGNPGKHQLTFVDGENKASVPVNLVDYALEAGDLQLLRGESTFMEIKVMGLEDVQDTVVLSIRNTTSDQIDLQGGDQQTWTILPDSEAAQSGVWEKRFTIQSLRTGSFAIDTDLQIRPSESDRSSGDQLVDCEINDTPILVPAAVCEKLKQEWADKIGETESVMPSDLLERPDILLQDVEVAEGMVQTRLYPGDQEGLRGVTLALITVEDDKIVEEMRVQPATASQIGMQLPEIAGVYEVRVIATYADNRLVEISRYFNYRGDPNSYTPYSALDRINGQIEQEIDELEANGNAQEENARQTAAEEQQAAEDREYGQQLEAIDAVLDGVEAIYAGPLRQLFDSLTQLRANVPAPDMDALNAEVERLEAALAACHQQLGRLQQLQAQLPQQLDDLEAQYKAIYDGIIDQLDRTGYRYENAGWQVNSDLYDRPVLMMGWCGFVSSPMSDELTRATRQAMREGAEISRQHRILMRRLAALPQQIQATDAQCEQLAEQLREARAALANANDQVNAHLAQLSMVGNSINELCRQISNILEGLEQWCADHPEDSSAITELLAQFMYECPQDVRALREYWRKWNRILEAKRRLEYQYERSAQRHERTAEGLREEGQRLRDARQRMEERLADLEQQRQAELERQEREAIEEQQRDARRKAECLRLLSEHWASESGESNALAEMAEAYDDLAAATGAGPGSLPELLDRITALNAQIDGVREQLQRARNLVNGMLDSATDRERAGAFKELLDISSQIARRYPGLGRMISFYAEAYSASIGLLLQVSDAKVDLIKPLVDGFRVSGCPQPGWEDKSMDEILEEQWDDFMGDKAAVTAHHRLTNEEQARLKEYFKQRIAAQILECCLRQLLGN